MMAAGVEASARGASAARLFPEVLAGKGEPGPDDAASIYATRNRS